VIEVEVKNLAGSVVGTLGLDETVFGVEPRADILHRTVRWQLAGRRAGTHKAKTRAEIARTGAKLYKQKGTGRARHGSRRPNIFRGGGVAHGPLPRDHAHSLPKKVRALALRCALSSKVAAGQLIVLDGFTLEAPKTKLLAHGLRALGVSSAVLIDKPDGDANFEMASRNLPEVQVLPVEGANVYDILRRETLIVSRDAVALLVDRLRKVGKAEAEDGEAPQLGGIAQAGPAPEPSPLVAPVAVTGMASEALAAEPSAGDHDAPAADDHAAAAAADGAAA
jgi:large subunit ribosomal protein L4